MTLDVLEERRTVHFEPVLLTANETLLHLAVLEGMGFAFLPDWMIRRDLAEAAWSWCCPRR